MSNPPITFSAHGHAIFWEGSFRHRKTYTEVPGWNADALKAMLRRRVLISCRSDFFESRRKVAPWRDGAFKVLKACTSLDILLLTRYPENIVGMVPIEWLDESWPAHIWMGVLAETRELEEKRLPILETIPAPLKFVSRGPTTVPQGLENLGMLFGGYPVTPGHLMPDGPWAPWTYMDPLPGEP